MSHENVKTVERFTEPLQIDDKKANPLTAKLDFNQSNGTVAITVKVTSKQIGSRTEDKEHLFQTLQSIMQDAVERAEQLERAWYNAQKDPNQTEMFTDQEPGQATG